MNAVELIYVTTHEDYINILANQRSISGDDVIIKFSKTHILILYINAVLPIVYK